MNDHATAFPAELLIQIVEHSVDAIIVVDDQGCVSYWNQAAARLFGFTSDEARHRNLHDLITPERFRADSKVGFLAAGAKLGDKPRGQVLDSLSLSKTGEEFWMECSTTDLLVGGRRWALAICRSAHERKQKEQVLKRQATTDALSGLANRGEFQLVLESKLDCPLSVAILDIDQFKAVNDTYGHPVGDDGIRFVSRCLKRHFTDALCVGRLGGDEFGLIIESTDPHELRSRFEELRNDVAASSQEASNRLTVSVGLVLSRAANRTARELLTLADEALYRSKNSGRNRVTINEME